MGLTLYKGVYSYTIVFSYKIFFLYHKYIIQLIFIIQLIEVIKKKITITLFQSKDLFYQLIDCLVFYVLSILKSNQVPLIGK